VTTAASRTPAGIPESADLPALLLHDSAIAHNIDVMARFCADSGVELAPHAKTHMSEELIERQLAAGAWGMTAATTSQVRTLVGFGVTRILHANMLVDRAAIGWIARTILSGDDIDYLCYVDSLAGLALLEDELDLLGPEKKLRVLIEVGFAGGRTGVRGHAAAVVLANAIAESERVELAGVSGFEGLMPLTDGTYPAEAIDFLRRMHAVLEYCVGAGLIAGTPIVSAGGSSFFDLVVAELGPQSWSTEVTCVLRSGCYITHDHGMYARTSPFGERGAEDGPHFVPAFELLASVLSRPEAERVIVGFGRRDAPTDDRLPVLLGRLGDERHSADTESWEVTAVNDHHAFLRVPANASVTPGEILRFGISHPCGAFDRWRSIPLVDDNRRTIGKVRPRL
jgi:D-serine dehydratase